MGLLPFLFHSQALHIQIHTDVLLRRCHPPIFVNKKPVTATIKNEFLINITDHLYVYFYKWLNLMIIYYCLFLQSTKYKSDYYITPFLWEEGCSLLCPLSHYSFGNLLRQILESWWKFCSTKSWRKHPGSKIHQRERQFQQKSN